MALRLLGLVLWGAVLSHQAHATIGICSFYDEIFQREIKLKIQAGVPFELMSTVFEDGHLIAKKAVRVAFNLWDETVTLKSGENLLARFTLPQGQEELCKYLEVEEGLVVGRKYMFRLLLNPLWGERLTRLQVVSGDSVENGKLMGINWRKLAAEMPSDKVLLEKEFQR